MGQKVNPVGMRVGIIRGWESTWFSQKQYGEFLVEDIRIREYLLKELKAAYVTSIEIEKTARDVKIVISTSRAGEVLGQEGANVERLAKQIKKMVSGKDVKIEVQPLSNPDLDATVLAKSIAEQLENRSPFRIVQKKALQRAMKAGAKGVKTMVSGRLAGADIARSEGYSEGIVPLHTLRSDIDYGFAEADTTFGKIGCKVWVCKGEIMAEKTKKSDSVFKENE